MNITDDPSQVRHELRGLLHEFSLGLTLYRQLAQSGNTEAESVFHSLLDRIQAMSDSHLLDPDLGIADEEPVAALVVDDGTNEREYLARLLRTFGVPTETASDGIDAIRFLRHQIPAVVLIDMQMPRCDGPQLIEFLQSNMRFDGVSIYGLSALTAEEAGIDDSQLAGWIMKPLRFQHIASLAQNIACLANLRE